MDLRFTPEELAFRDEVRQFFRHEIPVEIRRKVSEGRGLAREDYVTSQRIMNTKGWAVPRWPRNGAGRAGRRSSATSSPRRCCSPPCRCRSSSTATWSGR